MSDLKVEVTSDNIREAADFVYQAGYLGVAEMMRDWADEKGLKAWAIEIPTTDSYGSTTGENATVEIKMAKDAAERRMRQLDAANAAEFTENNADIAYEDEDGESIDEGEVEAIGEAISAFIAFMNSETDKICDLALANKIVSAISGDHYRVRDAKQHNAKNKTGLGKKRDETPRTWLTEGMTADEMRQAVVAAYKNGDYDERSFQTHSLAQVVIK